MLRNGETGDWIGTFEGHKGAVWAACLDPPALHAATASADFSARVWDAMTGDELHSFEHKHIVRTIDYSKSGKRILTGGPEKVIRIFDLQQPCSEPMTLCGSEASIRVGVWHSDDNVILSALSDKTGVRVWDVRSKSVVRILSTRSPVTSVEVSRDGRYITISAGNEVQVWDGITYMFVKNLTMQAPIESASFYPSTGRLISGGDDMWVRLFDFDSGEELDCNKGHHGPVHCVRFAPGGESYASGSEDGTIRIWRIWEPEDLDGIGGGGADIAEPFVGDPGSSGGGVVGAYRSAAVRVGVNEVSKKIEGFKIVEGLSGNGTRV
ncbi:hypothetical protein CBR_g41412 [Chara braunii]|uniref:Serine-threonine kinase receptor-associated protein n=1 Tax=Chara braunii TaxID=69332 RepID=A0A388LVS8_CHABU|nr:hypothetical protein CBR_g41412 [Chara braunii]|eukprot:GBG86416.1 hypothetical protein CBR_g41412 [Chara braunii]